MKNRKQEGNGCPRGKYCGIMHIQFYKTYETRGDDEIDMSYCNARHNTVCRGSFCEHYEEQCNFNYPTW